jgi:GntR family transcriptional regulator
VAPTSEARRVADDLRESILAGDLVDGARLPSLTALADRYTATHDVVRQAVGILRDEGLVVTRHGAGTFVRRFAMIVRASPGRLARAQWGSGAAIQDADTGPRPRTVDVVVAEIPAPEVAAAGLNIPAGELVLSRSRRFLVERRPVQLSTSYLPLDLVRGTPVTYTDTGPGGLYARLADLGHAPDRFVERVAARSPRPDERERLSMATRGGAVFEIIRRALAGDRCVEVNVMVLDAAAYELEYAFPAGNG